MESNNKRVLVLRHAEPEHLGSIAQALTQEGIAYTYLRPDHGEMIPSNLDGFSGLILMGGPHSLCEQDQFPFLNAEKSLARNAISTNRPVLGVCLGSQILSEVLGSRVYPGRVFELGWKKVTMSMEAAEDPVLGHLPTEIIPLHWHGDVYDLPLGSKPIGSSEMTPVQGFVSGQRFYGILFHLEAEFEQVTAMVAAFPEDVLRGGVTPAALVAEAPERVQALQKTGMEVFRRWALLV
jgi:GMP synthase (glutamine-hydrolysing)